MNIFIKEDWKNIFSIKGNNIEGMDDMIVYIKNKNLSLNDLKQLYNLYCKITTNLKDKFGG